MNARIDRLTVSLYWIAIAAAICAGTLFRSWGVLTGTLDFWADEAWWAVNAQTRILTESGIRPIGYMWLVQGLSAFDHRELVLRLPSLLAGVGVMVCVYFSAARLCTNRLFVFLAVCIVALHPKLILFAKELKPFSMEAFLHSGLILWALTGLQARRFGASFYAVAAGVFPFCYNVLFLYPGLFAAAVSVNRARVAAAFRRMTMTYWVVALVVAAAVLAALHGFVSDALGVNARQAFWGGKYDVFPLDTGFIGGVAWYAGKTWALITMPLTLPGLDSGVATAAKHLFGGVYLIGITAFIAQRRHAELALLAGPVVMVAFANVLGYWPYGPFRTNLFLVPAMVLVACRGLDWMFTYPRLRGLVVGFVLLAVLAVFPWNPAYHRAKHMHDGAPSPQLTEALDVMSARYRADATPTTNIMLTDWHSWRPLYYYLEYSPRGRIEYADLRSGSSLVRGPLNEADELAMLIDGIRDDALERDGTTRVWLVVTKLYAIGQILSHPVVQRCVVWTGRYATHDPDYHPVVVELRIPGTPACFGPLN